jgi:hypothetical protein
MPRLQGPENGYIEKPATVQNKELRTPGPYKNAVVYGMYPVTVSAHEATRQKVQDKVPYQPHSEPEDHERNGNGGLFGSRKHQMRLSVVRINHQHPPRKLHSLQTRSAKGTPC